MSKRLPRKATAPPAEIPQNIWDAAMTITKVWCHEGYVPEGAEAIARAILAEREACAKLAERADEYLPDDDRLEGIGFSGLDALVNNYGRIAAAIRKGAA